MVAVMEKLTALGLGAHKAKVRGFEAKREDYSHKKEPKGMPCGCCHKGVASFRVRVKMTAESR